MQIGQFDLYTDCFCFYIWVILIKWSFIGSFVDVCVYEESIRIINVDQSFVQSKLAIKMTFVSLHLK